MRLPRSALPTGFLAIAIGVPLLVSKHTLPLATFYGEWLCAALFCAAVLMLTFAARPHHDGQPAMPLAPAVVLVPLWLIATSLVQKASGFVDVTGSGLSTDLALALGAAVMLAAWRYSQSAEPADRELLTDTIATAWLAAGLLSALAQWAQVFRLEPHLFGLVSSYFYDTNRRLWGNLNQPNHLATIQGWALAASVWFAAKGKLRLPGWLMAVALLESGIVLSGSRTGMIHVGLASLYALMAARQARDVRQVFRREPNPMRRPVGLVFAAVALIVMLLVLQPAIRSAGQAFGWALFDAVTQIASKERVSPRIALWTHSLAMFRAHPWLGVGWGEFGWAQFEQLERVGMKVEMSLHAHNAILDLLAKTGAVGAGGTLLLLLAWAWRVVRVRVLRASAQERARAVLMLTWLGMLGVHSMLEYPLHYLYFLLPACFLIGWLEPAGLGPRKVPEAVSASAALIFVVASAGVLGTMWQDYRRAEAFEYASAERVDALPMPRFWFRQQAGITRIETAELTPANAAQWLPQYIDAVHLLPTPTLIARSAWLMALTGQQARARTWLDRLHFYYAGEEATQLADLREACAKTGPASRPASFCDWVRGPAPAG